MSIANRVQDYIADSSVAWDPVAHRPGASCLEAARLAHVPAERVAKAVVLKDAAGYVVAVIPGDAHLDMARLRQALGRDLELAPESEAARLFPDCALGAVPPFGSAYGIPTFWATSLGEAPDIYFEAGDKRTLVHMFGMEFGELMRAARALPPRTYH
jgi:Ala-tRNA(Pro) deacylase